jgi:hypothetical protein
MKFKMVATTGLSFALDPMGKMFQNASSLKPLGQLKPNCPGMIYNLALIIFVVSDKKAFEHFPIGSNVNLCPAVVAILDHWKVLYKVCLVYADRKSKIATTAGHKLTLDPMGKCSNAFFSETTNMIKAKLYMNVHWI